MLQQLFARDMVCGGGFRAISASARDSNDVTTHASTSARLARRGEPSQGVVVGDTLTGRNGGSLRGDYIYVRPAEAFFARPIPPPVLPSRPLPLREAVDALRALATDEDDAALELAALLTVADAPLVPGAPLPSRLMAPRRSRARSRALVPRRPKTEESGTRRRNARRGVCSAAAASARRLAGRREAKPVALARRVRAAAALGRGPGPRARVPAASSEVG